MKYKLTSKTLRAVEFYKEGLQYEKNNSLLMGCLMVIGLFCGCKQKKTKDTQISEVHRFTYKMAAGSMLSKDDMSEDERKMHDATLQQC